MTLLNQIIKIIRKEFKKLPDKRDKKHLKSYLSTQLQKQEQKLLKDLKTRIIEMEERLKKDIMRWLKGI